MDFLKSHLIMNAPLSVSPDLHPPRAVVSIKVGPSGIQKLKCRNAQKFHDHY